MPLADVLERLRARGRTLADDVAAPPAMDVATFVARGFPGAPDPLLDPVGQRLAGLAGVLHGGVRVAVRPSPRRATGPDLGALFVGASERHGRVEHAVLPAPRSGDRVARPLPFSGERTPPVSDGEQAAFERLASVLAAATRS
jgi:hypothetical protein